MSDSFSKVTSQGWLSRIMGAIKGVLVGLVFLVGSFILLFWNEGRAVQTARSLAEGAGVVASVPADRVDQGNEGRLVHLTGDATTAETLADPEFGVSAAALKLEREVELYQWEEEKRSEERTKLGGGSETVTTYEYKKEWSSSLNDSGDFERPDGHQNPSSLPFPGTTFTAQEVKLGGFTLSSEIVGRLTQSEPLRLDETALGGLPAPLRSRTKLHDGGFYLGADPAQPQVGDVRVRFEVVKPGPVSVVARQVSATFESYPTKAGDAILIVRHGTHSAESLFKAEQAANTALTWILRGVGFFVMFLGLTLVFRPLAVVADVVPLLGTLLGAGIGVFAGLTAASLSIVTIALAWVVYRPLLGITLLVLALGALGWLISIAAKRKRQRAGAPRAA